MPNPKQDVILILNMLETVRDSGKISHGPLVMITEACELLNDAWLLLKEATE